MFQRVLRWNAVKTAIISLIILFFGLVIMGFVMPKLFKNTLKKVRKNILQARKTETMEKITFLRHDAEIAIKNI